MLISLLRDTRKLILLLPFLSLLAAVRPAFGQDPDAMKPAEDTLNAILDRLNQAATDSARYQVNAEFHRALHDFLLRPGTDRCTFESIKVLVKATPDDGAFRIYHWNLPDAEGKKRYFGFLKLLNLEKPVVFPLRDMTDSVASPDSAILDAGNWMGALYYRVIPGRTAAGKTYYTLLGWAGNNARITRKIIEVLSFDENQNPVFGLPVFPGFDGGNRTRVIFRYSAAASMSLKYEEQPVRTDRTRNETRRESDDKPRTTMMIVFDRLVPMDPLLEGQYEFYVTAGDVYDGFVPEKGAWKFVRDVEAKNRR